MLAFSFFGFKMHVYLQKNNRVTSLKWQPHVTMTYNSDIVIYPIWYMNSLSFTLHGIWIPVMFNIHFCIQKCKYDKIVWRRTRRVGKTMQLTRFISFILILASVTSNNHTHMVFADVMSTSFADKLCLHIPTPAAYMTAPSISWLRLVVFRVLHGVFFRIRDKSAHDYCCFDVPR